jgi:hypothetical protein
MEDSIGGGFSQSVLNHRKVSGNSSIAGGKQGFDMASDANVRFN